MTRVLFMGNSYTVYNELPDMVGLLASDAGHTIDAQAVI